MPYQGPHADWLIEKALREKGPLDPWWREKMRWNTWPLPDLVLFGARMRLGRTQLGVSQRRLADLAGVSQSLISRLERGVATGIGLVHLVAVGMALGSDFPFGFCPHDDGCKWKYDPTHPKQPRPIRSRRLGSKSSSAFDESPTSKVEASCTRVPSPTAVLSLRPDSQGGGHLFSPAGSAAGGGDTTASGMRI